VRLNWLPQRHAARATRGGARGAGRSGGKEGLGRAPPVSRAYFLLAFFSPRGAPGSSNRKTVRFSTKNRPEVENTFLKRKPSWRLTFFRTLPSAAAAARTQTGAAHAIQHTAVTARRPATQFIHILPTAAHMSLPCAVFLFFSVLVPPPRDVESTARVPRLLVHRCYSIAITFCNLSRTSISQQRLVVAQQIRDQP
jgi:hypothetical protein